MPRNSAPSLRQLYQQWVEDQIEEYKDSVPRSDLLRLADEVVEDLRMNPRGQYQLTELLLCTAVDRKIFHLLELPGYRTWSNARRSASRPRLPTEPHPDTVPSPESRETSLISPPVPTIIAG